MAAPPNQDTSHATVSSPRPLSPQPQIGDDSGVEDNPRLRSTGDELQAQVLGLTAEVRELRSRLEMFLEAQEPAGKHPLSASSAAAVKCAAGGVDDGAETMAWLHPVLREHVGRLEDHRPDYQGMEELLRRQQRSIDGLQAELCAVQVRKAPTPH